MGSEVAGPDLWNMKPQNSIMRKIDLNIFQSTYPKLQPAKGMVLIAEPFLQGPYFSRSIILLTEHGSEGAVGFVINKSTVVYPDEVIDDLFNFEGELFIGGPVSSNTLHFIHTLGDLVPGSIPITSGIFWGGDFNKVKVLINQGLADSKDVKFFAGYSGWSPGQLEDEIAENSWVVTTLDDQEIMKGNSNTIWQNSLKGLGDVYRTWSNFPRNPAFN